MCVGIKWRSQFLEPRGIDKCQRCCSNINFCFASFDAFHQTREREGLKCISQQKEIPLIIILLLLSTRVKNKNYKLIITKSVFYYPDPRKYQMCSRRNLFYIHSKCDCAMCERMALCIETFNDLHMCGVFYVLEDING